MPKKRIADFILKVVADIPKSSFVKARKPKDRARALIADACLSSAALSGSLALPSGPLAMAAILPDLYGVWRIQARLVSDVAAVYGKRAELTRDIMLFCLFNHVAAQAVRDLAVRAGSRVLTRKVSVDLIRKAVSKISGKVSERVIRKSVARWLPFLGALTVAGYAYYDTSQVGETAVEIFSKRRRRPRR